MSMSTRLTVNRRTIQNAYKHIFLVLIMVRLFRYHHRFVLITLEIFFTVDMINGFDYRGYSSIEVLSYI